MNIVVSGRKVEVTPALKQYAVEKMSRFEKYLTKITKIEVTLSVQKHMHTAEALIMSKGGVIQAEATTEELYASIDELVDKLDRQVKKLKGKITSQRKTNDKRDIEADAETVAAALPGDGSVIERQTYEMKPMSPDDAALELNTTEMNFVVFSNAESGAVSVLYRKKNGNLGLIEPVAS